MNIKKYLNSLLLFICLLIFSSFIITILNYFNIISTKTSNILELITILVSTLISSVYLGKNSTKQGYIEGLKLGGILLIIIFLFNLITGNKISWAMLFFYMLILIIPVIGSITGINKKR